MMASKPISNTDSITSPLSASLPVGVWRGSEHAWHHQTTCIQAHQALDAWLPGGGWPLGSLNELLVDGPGCGEIGLVAPALRRLPASSDVVLLNPPATPNVRAWRLSNQRLWRLRTQRRNDAWWSAQTVLQSQAFGALLAWLDPIDPAVLRRLHACAQASNMLVFVFRPTTVAASFSPAPLRLALAPRAHDQVQITVLKSKGPKPTEPLTLPRQAESLAGKHSPWTEHVDGHYNRALA